MSTDQRVAEFLRELPWTLEVVKLSDISTDRLTILGQREIDMERVNKMAENYNPLLDDPALLARVKGRGLVCPPDGQHRVELNRVRKQEFIAARVLKDTLTPEDFSKLFVERHLGQKKLTPIEIFLAQSKAPSHYADVAAANTAVESSGYKVSKSPSNFRLGAPHEIKRIYKWGGADRITTTLQIMTDAYNGDKDSLKGVLLSGVAWFVGLYKDEMDRGDFVKSLRTFGFVGKGQVAKNEVKAAKKNGMRSDAFRVMAELLRQHYNSCLPESKKGKKLKKKE